MKKFQFNLEAVQIVRNRATNEALENYARALKARAGAEAALAETESALREQLEQWRKRMGKTFAPSDMLQHEHARTMLEARRNERIKQLRDAIQTATQAQSAFQLARQKSDVVERFHDRQRRDFNLALLKEEQHLLDDLAGSRREMVKGLVHA